MRNRITEFDVDPEIKVYVETLPITKLNIGVDENYFSVNNPFVNIGLLFPHEYEKFHEGNYED